jgi:hypothetical protein
MTAPANVAALPRQAPSDAGRSPACSASCSCAWLALSWPWLSGAVTIPWDAKAHFHPQLQFLAASWHKGLSPFWTPYVFSGSPQVADPQS